MRDDLTGSLHLGPAKAPNSKSLSTETAFKMDPVLVLLQRVKASISSCKTLSVRVCARPLCRDTKVYTQISVMVSALGWRNPELHRISKQTKIKQSKLNCWNLFNTLFSQDFAYLQQQISNSREMHSSLWNKEGTVYQAFIWNPLNELKFATCPLSTFTGLPSWLYSPAPLFFDSTYKKYKKSMSCPQNTIHTYFWNTRPMREISSSTPDLF